MAFPLAPRDWFVGSGAQQLARASDVGYAEYTRHVAQATALPATFEDDCAQIALDLERILPSVKEFLLGVAVDTQADDDDQSEARITQSAQYRTLVAKLRNVLTAYSVRNARVGYVQGHADLLCFVLAHTPTVHSEEQAFWIYATVIERIFPEDFFARSPKLHGFHIDVKVFEVLMAKRLVPHMPQLAQVDLALLSSLLGCKWFIPVWVGELPPPLLVDLWDAMLCKDDGTYLHMSLALHFVRLACDSNSPPEEPMQWEASFVYKNVLAVCRGLEPTFRLADIHQEAQAVYNLSDEGFEDWRSDHRGQASVLASEARALLQTVHFQPSEIARFHGEFMFARTYLKNCERQHLRGVRQDFVDGLLAREFSMLPVDLCRRIVDLIRRDAYGNISFYILIQLLSVLRHGSQEERAMLIFSAVDNRHSLSLDHEGIQALADILCSLAIHQLLHETSGERGGCGWPTEVQKLPRPEHSPLLRAHFLSLLDCMKDQSSDRLGHDKWLQGIAGCSDIHILLTDWNTSSAEDRVKRNLATTRGSPGHRNCSGTSSRLASLAQVVSRSRPSCDRSLSGGRRTKWSVAESSKKCSKSAEEPVAREGTMMGGPSISLLPSQMRKKHVKQSKSQHRMSISGSSMTKEPGHEISALSSERVFWCECAIS